MVWNGYTADLEESSGQNSRFGTPGFLSERRILEASFGM